MREKFRNGKFAKNQFIKTFILFIKGWCLGFFKVIRIEKKRVQDMVQEMSQFGKVVRTFGFLNVFGAAEKIQAKL